MAAATKGLRNILSGAVNVARMLARTWSVLTAKLRIASTHSTDRRGNSLSRSSLAAMVDSIHLSRLSPVAGEVRRIKFAIVTGSLGVSIMYMTRPRNSTWALSFQNASLPPVGYHMLARF